MLKHDPQGVCYSARNTRRNTLDDVGERVIVDELLPIAIAMRTSDGQVRPRTSGDELLLAEVRRRFESEVEALCDLSQHGLAKYYFAKRERGTNYVFSEWIRGESLASWLEQPGVLTRRHVLDLILPVLDAVDALHRSGQVHGRIDTSSIRIRSDGSGVLAGLQPGRHFIEKRLGLRLGETQPGFGAPEQLEAHKPATQVMHDTPATDVYALGAMLYRLVTGRAPLSASERCAAAVDPLINASTCAPRTFGEGLLRAVDQVLALNSRTGLRMRVSCASAC